MFVYHRPPAKLTRVTSSIPCFRSVSRATSSPFIREENQNPNYDPRKYYPARVGETISRRYRIISKLGWGANSTPRSNYEGRAYIRLVREYFGIKGALGEHLCLLHIIHTDLKADNFLVGFEDSTVLESYACQQESNPAPYQDNNGHPIFQSCPDFGHLRKGVGLVQISNFSTAVFGNILEPYNYDIQPQPFCALEVHLKATWTYSADIWSTMLWELLADSVLFDGLDPRTGMYSREKHIAQMIRLLGPPPLQLLKRADQDIYSELFSSRGEFVFPGLVPPEEFHLSYFTPFVHGEDKRLFLEFEGRMLRWEPGDRSTARELYNDPWLKFKP
ncbi:kinase domain protein [Aspergillus lucknowensis]|uniref:Kinase domain protein n=1 Tax=Aspergillus lucknowensis TaxID=176173 RepID=A0ABR4LNU1_9EURO